MAAGDRIDEGVRARTDGVLETGLAIGECGGECRAAFDHDGVDLVVGVAEAVADFVAASSKRIGKFAGAVFEHGVQHFLAGSKRRCERQRLVGQCIADPVDAGRQDAFDRIRTACDGFVDAGEAVHQLAIKRAGALVECRGKMRQAVVEGCRKLANGCLETVFEEAGAEVEIHDRVVGSSLQALTEGGALLVERAVERGDCRVQRAAERLLAVIQTLGDFAGAGKQRLVELTGAVGEGGVQLFGVGIDGRRTGFELAEQFLTAFGHGRCERVEADIELGGQSDTGRCQARDEVFGTGGHQGAERFTGSVGFCDERRGAGVDHRGKGLA